MDERRQRYHRAPDGRPAGARRRDARTVVDRRALLRGHDGRIIAAPVHDVSLGGLQLRCDPLVAYLLHFDGRRVDRAASPRYEVRLALPIGEELTDFRAAARVLHLTPLAERRHLAVGMAFELLDPGPAALLATLLAGRADPAG